VAERQEILERIDAVARRPAIIAVDGPSGAGKSTLARRLQEELAGSAQIVEGDDFYRDMPDEDRARLSPAEGFRQYFDWERLKSQVLDPARSGAQTLRYQKYDWDNAELGEWVEVPTPEVLILDGVYSHRPEFAGLADLRVYVQTPETVRVQRQAERDENDDAEISRWKAAEDHYLHVVAPAGSADILVSGEASWSI